MTMTMNRDSDAILNTPRARTWDLGKIKEKISDDPRLARLIEQAEHELNDDWRQRIAGILSYTEASKARMLEAASLAAAAKRRKWAAEDRLEQIRQELARAEAAAEDARKDFLEAREQMRANWEVFFKPEVEARPLGASLEADGEAADGDSGAGT